ncbi:MAG: NAD-dependent isocitrate dehydrogenase, partial [Peptostreptococcus sp.]|nr:NAD-dependent isocitrate dehydrogenase [Peptostreptococcus sp.]
VIEDAAAMNLVLNPEKFDVLVMPNLYGDILSDLCAGLVGGLGIIPSANIGEDYAVFEAVHGSAPQIAGQGIANPTALIQSAVMMLRYIGEHEAALKIENALKEVFDKGQVITTDLGGKASTDEFADELCRLIKG